MAEFGLFLGVSDHARDTTISRLKYPGQDATKLWSLFAQKLNWGERALLVSPSDQTATRIDDLLRRIGKQIRSGDRFVFYFAGHGLQRDKDQYLLLPNTDLNKLRRGLVAGNDVLSLDSLMDTVANWRGEAHSLFVLDCCRVSLEAPPGSRDGSRLSAEVEDVLAGLTRRDIGLRRSSGSGGGGASAAERFEHLSINVLNATGDKGQAYELDTLEGSVFATTWGRRIHAAVEQGRPYLVDAQEVEEGLSHDMFEALPDAYRDRPQRPFLSRPDQPFVIHRPAVAMPAPTPSPSSPPAAAADTGPSPQTSAQLELLAKAVLRGQAEDAPLALQAMGGLTDTARQALAQWAQAHGDTQVALAQAQAQVQALQAELAQVQSHALQGQAEQQAQVERLAAELQQARGQAQALGTQLETLKGQLADAQRALKEAQDQQAPDALRQTLADAHMRTQGLERDARVAQRELAAEREQRLRVDLSIEATTKSLVEARRQRLHWSAAALALGLLAGGGAGWGWKMGSTKPALTSMPNAASLASLPEVERVTVSGVAAASAVVDAGPSLKLGDRDCEACPKLVWQQGGRYRRGSENRDSDEKPVRWVSVGGYWLGESEVTVVQYLVCVQAKACDEPAWREPGNQHNLATGSSTFYKQRKVDTPNHPVVGVSWHNAQQYVAWLNQVAGVGNKYKLPSEAQWEWSARGGGAVGGEISTDKRWGDIDDEAKLGEVAWYSANAGGTLQPVCSKQRQFGLCDMHGLVWEWVQDAYAGSYEGAPDDGSARAGARDEQRVLRGGSWINLPQDLRSADRFRRTPDKRYNFVGFRIARIF